MKTLSHDSTQPLPCARKEKYCQLRADGQNMSEAYANAGFKPHGGNARRLSQNEQILSRIDHIRSYAAEQINMTKTDLLRYLVDVLKTAPGDVDETSQLAQEVTREYLGKEEATQVIKKKVKMVGKMDAAKLLATLTGWNAPEKVEQKIEIVITKTW